MYSAETAESWNYTSPREGKFQQVGQSQSFVIYNRSGIVQRNSVARGNITRKAEKLYPWKEDVFTSGSFSKEQWLFQPNCIPEMDVLIDSWKAWRRKEFNNKIIVFLQCFN